MSDRQSCHRTRTMFKSFRPLFKIKAQVRLPRVFARNTFSGNRSCKYGTTISICMALERVPESAVHGKISHEILLHVKLVKVGSLRPTARRI